MSNYATPQETAALIRKATPDELWLAAQIKRINPWAHEMGADGAHIAALEKLALEQRDELARLKGDVA